MQISNSKQNKRALTSKNEKGFTVLELVIAMVVFLIVSSAIWGLLVVAQRSRVNVSEKVQLTKNVRFALNIIGRDTYNAGFGYPIDFTVVLKNNAVSSLLGIPQDGDNSRDTVPPIIAGDNITTNTFNLTPNVKTDQVTFLFKDSTFNLIGTTGSEISQPLSINAATTTSGIDEIVPISGSNVNCRVNDILVVNGNTGATLGVVTALNGTNKVRFANGDVLGFNLTGSSGSLRGITTPASMHRVKMVTYYVTPDGILTRRDYANSPTAAFVDEPLVYGVENFQIQYVLDSGLLSDNPQANLIKTRQVRFTISVRSTELDPSGQPYRTTMTTTYSTRNLGYDAN